MLTYIPRRFPLKLPAFHHGISTWPTKRLTLKLVKSTGRNSMMGLNQKESPS